MNNPAEISLVGEYALRLLSEPEARALEVRLRAEPELRRLLAEWEDGLGGMADEFVPVRPPPAIKTALEARLFGPPKRRFGLKWFGVLVGIAAMLAVVFLNLVPPSSPVMTAQIEAADHSLVLNASYDPASETLEITRATGAARSGRVLELWLIAQNSEAPVSLGVLPAGPVAEIKLSETMAERLAGGTLAVSDEPIGGSPTGAPTGVVLAVGEIIIL